MEALAPYTLTQVAERAGGTCTGYAAAAQLPIRTWLYDSRQLLEPYGAVFLALRGQQRDGHAFVEPLYRQGVRLFWVERVPEGCPEAAFLVVEDVLSSLQQLAAYHRQRFQGRVVGITGSNGKTQVKEWLTQLLDGSYAVYKSPRSYNSQLGVALALLGLGPGQEIALIECGVSRSGEMKRLAEMVQPDLGILTHMGDAHDAGFADVHQKLAEKLLLFHGVKALVTHAHDEVYRGVLSDLLEPWKDRLHTPKTLELADTGGITQAIFQHKSEVVRAAAAVTGTAGAENLVLSALSAHVLGVSPYDIRSRSAALRPLELRTELLTDNPEVVVLNDAYNADSASLANALALWSQNRLQPHRRIILSDLEQLGDASPQIHRQVVDQLLGFVAPEAIELIGPTFQAIAPASIRTYDSVDGFLLRFDYSRYVQSVVLLKGARRFALERVVPYLTRHPGPTHLRIHLPAAQANLRVLRARVPLSTGLLVMLKAGAYGTGSWQMAHALKEQSVAYFAVAQPVEGMELRGRGIREPILVQYPDPELVQCVRYGLEPVISGTQQLHALGRLPAPESGRYRVHLEVDTGMGRLGFAPQHVPNVVDELRSLPVDVATCFTHLAASEDPSEDSFTHAQVKEFLAAAQTITHHYPNCRRHVLNTGGVLRFPQYAFELVRVGIGLFGIDPRESPPEGVPLEEVASMHSVIAQLHAYPADTTVGYGRRERLHRDSVIATVPVGYADGIPRNLGERKAQVLVREQRADIVGRICMDLLMVDVTDVPGARVGDEVVLFGRQGKDRIELSSLAAAAETIPYELLARIPARVRRVYTHD